MSVIITLLALSFVVFIHELGHMLYAKKAGIGVIEFSVGFGPKLFTRRTGDTIYSFRLFPLGGYVKLAGLDDSEDSVFSEDRFFQQASLLGRIKTIVAGSWFNILLGFFLVWCVSFFVGVAYPAVKDVLPNSPAAQAGLIKDDVILNINNQDLGNNVRHLLSIISQSDDEFVRLTYQRDNTTFVTDVRPEKQGKDANRATIGIMFSSHYRSVTFFNSVRVALFTTKKTIIQVFEGLKMLFLGSVSMKDMAGPLGIIQFASFGLQQSIISFIEIMALISVSLGVVNLLPFPVLDGGHLIFLIIEAIRRRPVAKDIQLKINNVGAILLISLMLFIVSNDVMSWSDRVSILKGEKQVEEIKNGQ